MNTPQILSETNTKNQTPQILPETTTNLNFYCTNERGQTFNKLILIYYSQGKKLHIFPHIHTYLVHI